MKKTLLGIAGILAMISSANAEEGLKTLNISIDTSKIQAACESSDKTLWDNRNKVCIPRNPCKNSKYGQYCNRDFAHLQLTDREYEAVINHYAEVKKLDCKAVPQEGKVIGQDYVVCMGNDVMVFEFGDINERFANTDNCISEGAMKALCTTMGGTFVNNDKYHPRCVGVDKSECQTIDKYFSFGERMSNGDSLPFTGWWEESSACTLGCPGRFM